MVTDFAAEIVLSLLIASLSVFVTALATTGKPFYPICAKIGPFFFWAGFAVWMSVLLIKLLTNQRLFWLL